VRLSAVLEVGLLEVVEELCLQVLSADVQQYNSYRFLASISAHLSIHQSLGLMAAMAMIQQDLEQSYSQTALKNA